MRFNSKLVRLKGAHNSHPAGYEICSFNSKLVRLKARDGDVGGEFGARFNSKLVRLKAAGDGAAGLRLDSVSIPNWCD